MDISVMISMVIGFAVVAIIIYLLYVYPLMKEAKAIRTSLDITARNVISAIESTNTKPKESELDAKLKIVEDENTVLTKEVSCLEGNLISLQETILDLTTNLSDLLKSNDGLQTELVSLKTNFKHITDDLEALEKAEALRSSDVKAAQAIIKVGASKGSDLDTIEFNVAVEEVLRNINNPTTPYETGIYNGIVSVANVVLGKDTYALKEKIVVTPPVLQVIHTPKRDNKGRFLKSIKESV